MSYSTGNGARHGAPGRAAQAPMFDVHTPHAASEAPWAEEARFMDPDAVSAAHGAHGNPTRSTGHAGVYSTALGDGQGDGFWRSAVHGTGALVSLGLVAWIGVWGYGQVKRDVSGVPVVQALEGPMRELPERPGGQISDHAGLAVNAVKAGAPEQDLADKVRLAPSGAALADEDLPTPALTAPAASEPGQPVPAEQAPAVLPVVEAALEEEADVSETGPALSGAPAPARSAGIERNPAVAAAEASTELSTEPGEEASTEPGAETQAEALARALTEGLAPLALEAEGVSSTPSNAALPVTEARVPASEPGVARSPRPPMRPDTLSLNTVAQSDAAFTSSGGAEAPEAARQESVTVVPGSRLVQLGAFDTAEEAEAAWDVIASRFAPLMEDKGRVVQQAEAGGRAFWRLRAAGFPDLAEARKFCAALIAERTDCIPVVAR